MSNKFSFLSTEFSKNDNKNKDKRNSESFSVNKNTTQPSVNIVQGRRSNPDYKTVGIQLPIYLHKKAKKILLINDENQNFSELMTKLLEKWVDEKENND
jgi:hypothetical protein